MRAARTREQPSSALVTNGAHWIRAGTASGRQIRRRKCGAYSRYRDLGSGRRLRCRILNACLAEGIALTGDLDNAFGLLEEVIAQIERPGWEERLHSAEILRLKGWMLSLQGDLDGAERNFLASLDWARRQQAKMWELRTSTSLARLWLSQGKRQDAYELLAPVYGWFTEGFDTKDLQDAKSLLDELASLATAQAESP